MISGNQVINYTYPDPRHRVQIDIGVAYGSDTDQVRQVITDAVRGVEGVLAEKPVDVFYLKFGDSARLVRVRWWIDNYDHRNPMLDKVNPAIESALDDAGIDMPNTTYDLNVNSDQEAGDVKPAAPETSEKQSAE
jgi:potassium efflux system protein